MRLRSLPILALAVTWFGPMAAQEARPLLSLPPMDGSLGSEVFSAECAGCHMGDESSRAPGMVTLSGMSPGAIVRALETGRMQRHGENLSREQRVAIAEWVTGRPVGESGLPDAAYCGRQPTGAAEVHWSGWGGGHGEPGYRDAAGAGFTAADLDRLELAWAFAFPEASEVRSKPAVVGDRVIVGSQNGFVYSLDLSTGCVHWTFEADASVRGAITIGEADGAQAAFFVDFRTNAYAIDAASGELIWRVRAGEHADHTNTGSIAYHDGRLFVPISSMEIATAMDPSYECCTSSGGIVALSSATGDPIWQYWTISEEPREVGETEVGSKIFAPSGAPVWSSPTVDAARGRLYFGTGENYSRPTTETSDAILALDMETGEVAWSMQATEGDAWNLACTPGGTYQNCPDTAGPDLDFGMAPIIATRDDGTQILVAGQKSGVVWALDPDANGELVWVKRVGKGGALGGVHWGAATDGERVYVPNSDHPLGLVVDPRSGQPAQANSQDAPSTGVYAIELGGGEVLWEAAPPRGTCRDKPGCMRFFSAAATAIDGAVLVGNLDGHLRAYSTEDGSVLMDIDTTAEFETVNGIAGRGGALDGPGPVVARGMLLVNSGYSLFGQMPGNLLLAYRVAPR